MLAVPIGSMSLGTVRRWRIAVKVMPVSPASAADTTWSPIAQPTWLCQFAERPLRSNSVVRSRRATEQVHDRCVINWLDEVIVEARSL